MTGPRKDTRGAAPAAPLPCRRSRLLHDVAQDVARAPWAPSPSGDQVVALTLYTHGVTRAELAVLDGDPFAVGVDVPLWHRAPHHWRRWHGRIRRARGTAVVRSALDAVEAEYREGRRCTDCRRLLSEGSRAWRCRCPEDPGGMLGPRALWAGPIGWQP